MKKLLFTILLFSLIAGNVLSKTKDKSFILSSLHFEYTSSYDDNILRYSDRDIGRFENSTEVYPSRLSTYDDWKNDFRLKFYLNGPNILNNVMKIRYFAKFSGYYRNPFNNYSNHTLLIYQDITESLQVDFKYFYMPKYYLREYRDRDLNEYHSCDFENHQIKGGVSYKVRKRTEVNFGIEFEQYYFNKYFTEYDSENINYEIGVRQDLGRDTDFIFDYTFCKSDNIGYVPLNNQQSGAFAEEDAEYGDSSYDADIFTFEFRHRFRKLAGHDTDLSIQYKLRNRYYTTDNSIEIDPFHAGRADKRHRIILSLDREIFSKLDANISYTYEWRDVESDVSYVPDIKDFQQNVLSLGLTYKIK